MFNLVALSAFRKVCLYLPSSEASRQLENVLKSENVAAFCVTTPSEFRKAARNQHLTAVVTVSSRIDEVRQICQLPIIDIQLLVEDWCHKASHQKMSAFETLTFLQGTCFVAMRR